MQSTVSRNNFKKEKKVKQLTPPVLDNCDDFDEDEGHGQLDATIEK